MPRKLNALEIAEGALLSDIAVVFQLLVLYLPVGGDLFRLPIFIVFAVLVLRRGLYVGIMGMCVSFFIVGVVMGPAFIPTMFLEAAGGLFLGITMRHRLRHITLILIGISCGALALYCLTFITLFLGGLPITNIVRSLHYAYLTMVNIVNTVSASVGLGNWWRHTLYPPINVLAMWSLVYWWALLYAALWLVMLPVVPVVYAMTNVFARLLGYEVRAFPGLYVQRLIRRLSRPLVRRMVRQRRQRREGKPLKRGVQA